MSLLSDIARASVSLLNEGAKQGKILLKMMSDDECQQKVKVTKYFVEIRKYFHITNIEDGWLFIDIIIEQFLIGCC